jgi:hypothetical protein
MKRPGTAWGHSFGSRSLVRTYSGDDTYRPLHDGYFLGEAAVLSGLFGRSCPRTRRRTDRTMDDRLDLMGTASVTRYWGGDRAAVTVWDRREAGDQVLARAGRPEGIADWRWRIIHAGPAGGGSGEWRCGRLDGSTRGPIRGRCLLSRVAVGAGAERPPPATVRRPAGASARSHVVSPALRGTATGYHPSPRWGGSRCSSSGSALLPMRRTPLVSRAVVRWIRESEPGIPIIARR